MAFGSMNPQSVSPGLALLKQIQTMQAPGGAMATGADGSTPNFMQNGLIGRLMSGNPGGLIGAIMKQQSAPVNPGAPPPPGDPAYVEGGQGPMAGGPPAGGGGFMGMGGGGMPQGLGMLAKLFGGGG